MLVLCKWRLSFITGEKRDMIPLNDLGPGENIEELFMWSFSSLTQYSFLLTVMIFSLRGLLYTGPEGEETHSG